MGLSRRTQEVSTLTWPKEFSPVSLLHEEWGRRWENSKVMITLPRDTENQAQGQNSPNIPKPLHPLPAVCAVIDQIEDWSSKTVLALVPVVEACPVLTTTILRAANLPLYGLKNKISTLSHAMAMLGVPALRNLLSGSLPKDHETEENNAQEKRSERWKHALVTAGLARAFAIQKSYDLPEEAFVAGLLHQLDELTFSCPHSLDDENSAKVSTRYLQESHLPHILVESIRLMSASKEDLEDLDPKTQELTALLSTSEHLATVLGDKLPNKIESAVNVNELAQDLGFTAEELTHGVAAARTQVATILTTLGAKISEDCDLSSPLNEASNINWTRDSSTPSRIPAPSKAKSNQNPLQVVRTSLAKLRKTESTSKILDQVMKVAHTQFGFDRVLYFRHDETESELVGCKILDDSWRAVDPSEIHIPLSSLSESLTESLKESRAAVLEENEKDLEILRYFGVQEMGAIPINDDEQLRGILFIDNFYSRTPLATDLLTSLEILCSEAALLMEKIKLSSESKALKKFAEKDELTGLNNRRYCIELCRKEVERARRYKTPLTLVMIDVDKFKSINDTLGHQVGDRVLAEVARLIGKNSRRSDIIGRYGGDEFVVLLPEIPTEQAIVYAERMRNRVEQLRLDLTELTQGATFAISLGVGSLIDDDLDFDDLVARVDKALYAAKNRGRNRVCLA